ncbi:auxin efflux carrier [Salinisphaera dokdonensis CL-ES53]|uniref:Auxin efflux carrier n=1 Tax=Salinisphaera dokdonensis CL-ES53 TaxID=1304272 RepID=A0ABV2B1R0_9GAMM
MLVVQSALAPLFALIALGALLGWRDYPGGDFWPRAERLIYTLLFPALLIATLAGADMQRVALLPLATVVLGPLLLFAALLWAARSRLGLDAAAFTSLFQGALRFNTYVALAGAAALHGSNGLLVAAVAIALLVPTINVFCVLCFVASGTLGRAGIGRSLRELLRNPLILGCAIGIALNISGMGLPAIAEPTLELLGRAALPLGLITVGTALRPGALWRSGRAFWLSAAIKLAALPATALALARLIDLDGQTTHVALLFMAVPTATSAYILARQLGGDSELMAAVITGQTLLAMLTLTFWLSVAA